MKAQWMKFWTDPTGAEPLAILRIGVSLLLLLQAYWTAPQYFDLYSSNGILQGTLTSHLANNNLPGTFEIARALGRVGVSEHAVLSWFAAVYLVSLAALLLGFHTRVAAIAVWFVHLILASGHPTSYGFDTFVTLTLFYFLWMPIGNAFSIDVLSGDLDDSPSSHARLSLRVLQLHLSIAYFFCGLDKGLGIQWWNGESMWRSLMMPLYAQGDFSWMAEAPWLLALGGWVTVIVEGLYPLGMWIPRLRKFWLPAIVGLHLGIFFFMGLHLFALMMILLSVSAFGVRGRSFHIDPASRFGVKGVSQRRNACAALFC